MGWMEEFSLEGWKRLRVWKGSLPWTEGADACGTEPRSAAVELLIPMGGSFMYGLLGAELEQAPSSDCLIDVRVLPAAEPYPGVLAAGLDHVETGLPDEYVQAVLGGATWAAGMGTGRGLRIRFCCAAHGAVGSSPVVFARLAAMVVRILSGAHPVLDAASCEDLVAWSRSADAVASPSSQLGGKQ